MTTIHPCRAKSSALAQPMPDAPPVIATTCLVTALPPLRWVESRCKASVAKCVARDLIKIQDHAKPGFVCRQQTALTYARMRRSHSKLVAYVKGTIGGKHFNMID